MNELKVNYVPKAKEETEPVLFVDYLRQWLKEEKGLVEQSTYEGNVIYVEKHIIPYFAPKKLYIDEVKPKH